MSGAWSTFGSFWAFITHNLDPFCGPAGLFSLLAGGTHVACGDTGWGDEIAAGVWITLALALATLLIGLCISFLIALAAQSQEKSARLAAGIFYTTIFRGLPELEAVNLWWFFREAWYYGLLSLTLNTAAYRAEIVRGAIRIVPAGQSEEAAALGISKWVTFRRVILPKALIVALRPYGNEVIDDQGLGRSLGGNHPST